MSNVLPYIGIKDEDIDWLEFPYDNPPPFTSVKSNDIQLHTWMSETKKSNDKKNEYLYHYYWIQ